MKSIKKLYAPKEVQAAIGILDEISLKFDNEAFRIVRDYIEKALFKESVEFAKLVQGGMSVRKWIYAQIANISGDLVESGNFHMYRGVINTLGPGSDLIRLFDMAIDESVKIGEVDAERAKTEKKALRENIKSVG